MSWAYTVASSLSFYLSRSCVTGGVLKLAVATHLQLPNVILSARARHAVSNDSIHASQPCLVSAGSVKPSRLDESSVMRCVRQVCLSEL
jgi:hypothetical protein